MRITAQLVITLVTALSILPQCITCQVMYTAGGKVLTTILGTSNIHDWELVSQVGDCTMMLQRDRLGQLEGLGSVVFSMQVNSLKSEHGSQMDNNTYKAMEEPIYPQIRFVGATGSIRQISGGVYTLNVPGRLSIHGVTKDVVLTATARTQTDGSVAIEGSYPLVTTDYNVPPIRIMLGAIYTSAKVTIRYEVTIRPS